MAQDYPRFRTPLSRARGLGSAKHGVGDFIGQRASAVALLFLLLWGVWSALKLAPLGYEGVAEWLRSPIHAGLLVLLLAAGFYHVHIGVRVIIEDYLGRPITKTLALLANLFVCAGAFAIGATAALKVAFSASGAV